MDTNTIYDRVVFTGNLNINYAEECKEKLVSVIEKSDNINVRLTDVNYIDFSFIQMLYMTEHIVRMSHKSINFNIETDEKIRGIIEKCGFGELLYGFIR
ncbi:MAG: hypothetical protein Q8880_04610 [Bacteroidota bacterium]|nr:hypothetical protein [Bacteroidota bacterium]